MRFSGATPVYYAHVAGCVVTVPFATFFLDGNPMKFEDFTSGTWKQQYQYKSFQPTPVNLEWSWEEPRINVLLAEANRTLGELNAMTMIAPNVDLFINMHVAKEATMSSRIEGTKTEMDEIFLDEMALAPERRQDQREVKNYIRALNTAIKDLERLPLSLRLLRNTHEILMSGVRGEYKAPGEFRRSQNWIGGASLADAAFIPPHQDDIGPLLDDLEAFWHNESIQVPHLIRIALSHYQFETIHPFLDGNGRIGRLLITLYLVSHGLLAKPSLYLSAHLEQHRTDYYDALSGAMMHEDITGRAGAAIQQHWDGGVRSRFGMLSHGFPNMFMLCGPGSTIPLFLPYFLAEEQLKWIGDCIGYMAKAGKRTIEPTAEAEDDWGRQCNDTLNMTLFPRTASWYMGANVPGKPRTGLAYFGGMPNYRRQLAESAAAGYSGFELG